MAAEASRMESGARQKISRQHLEEMQGGGEAGGTREAEDASVAGEGAETAASTGQDGAANPDIPTTASTGKFVSGTSGDVGELFDLVT